MSKDLTLTAIKRVCVTELGHLLCVKDGSVDVRLVESFASNAIALTFRAWADPLPVYTVEYPETWWDAFKLRFFPAWALRRFPARIHHEEYRPFAFYDVPRQPSYLDVDVDSWTRNEPPEEDDDDE